MQDFPDNSIDILNTQKLTEKDKLKAYSLLSKPYLQESVLLNCPYQLEFSNYKAHLIAML